MKIRMTESIGEVVATNMQEIVTSNSHINMFAAPEVRIKTASETCCQCDNCSSECSCHGHCNEVCKSCAIKQAAVNLQHVVNNLVNLSSILDDFGLNKSSAKTLLALDNIISEIALQKFADPIPEFEVENFPEDLKSKKINDELLENLDLPELDEELPEDSNNVSEKLYNTMKGMNYPDKRSFKGILDASPLNDPDFFDDEESDGPPTIRNLSPSEIYLMPKLPPPPKAVDPDEMEDLRYGRELIDDDGNLQLPTFLDEESEDVPLSIRHNHPIEYDDTVFPNSIEFQNTQLNLSPKSNDSENTKPPIADWVPLEARQAMTQLDAWLEKHATEEEDEEEDLDEEEDFEDE